jgi:glycosyltransferase involved in cell wall biosynthesis
MSSDRSVVSVVMPVFNGAAHLAETLWSVLEQSYQATELIVVDDGSTDDSLRIVAAEAPEARVIRQSNAGVSAARNRGLSEARGRYVIFLDQDDVWHPEQLARQVAWLEAHPDHGAAVCRYHHWRPVNGVYPEPAGIWGTDPGLRIDPAFTGFVYHQFLFDCWALTSGTLLRRDIVSAAGGFDEHQEFGEDWELWLRLSLTTRFACLTWPPVLYRHHHHQGSRIARRRDFRVELLERFATRHGLASADGRAMPAVRFVDILATYRAGFGRHELAHGDRWIGVRALFDAWLRRPGRVRLLLQAVAGCVGWRGAGRDGARLP